MSISRHTFAFPLLPLMLVACSGDFLLKPPSGLDLSSEPSGAEVMVMGNSIGTTPLVIPVGTLYPNQFDQENTALYGRVVLRKKGCEEVNHTINSRMLEKGLHVKFKCGVIARETPTPPEPPRSIAERLRALDSLLEQGVINMQEHATQRARILDEL